MEIMSKQSRGGWTEVSGANKVKVDRQKTLYFNDTNLYLMYLATRKEKGKPKVVLHD